jgi:hypothetical protein
MAVKKYAIDRAKRVLGDSGLAEMIIASAGSKNGFEIRYRSLPPRVVASTTSHAHAALGMTPENPGYYKFVYESLYTAISLVDDGRKYKIEFLPKKFRMDGNAVELFLMGWDRLSKGDYGV